MTKSKAQIVVEERDDKYAGAWKRTGEVMAQYAEPIKMLLVLYPYMFLPYVTILCKWFRILGSPTNPDHWLDIAGYAQLVVEELDKDD